jgi:hypothetical protein
MLQQRKLTDKTKGMFAGPRMAVGQYLDQGLAQTSGVTYGGGGLGWYWDGYPNVTGGLTELDPKATETGSNLSTAQMGQYYGSQTAVDAGLDGAPTGSSVGGTAAY